MNKYDQIGKTYNSTRVADLRITDRIVQYLDLPAGSRLLDIGAGTGNYSYELANRGFEVIAVEPSETMRQQGKQHRNLKWVEGFAESLPVEDQSIDGVVCTLATHHFTNLELCFREMARVIRNHGKIVIFTADPRTASEPCWITDYFTEIVEQSCKDQPELNIFKQLFDINTARSSKIEPFLLPYDLRDKFFFSGWRTPELYLDELYRGGISPLASAPRELLDHNLTRLSDDLESNKWKEQYGEVLHLEEYDCGYYFLVG